MRIRMRHKAALDAGMSNDAASEYANDPNSPPLSLLSSAQVQSSTTPTSSGNSGAQLNSGCGTESVATSPPLSPKPTLSISADKTGRHELDADRFMTKNSGLPESPNDIQPSGATTDYVLSDSRGPGGKFKQGHPKLGGRRKGQRNRRTIVDDVLKEPFTIRRGKRSRKVTKFEAMIVKTSDDALLGNAKAVSTVIALIRTLGLMGEPHEATHAEPLTGDDPSLISDFLRRHGI